METMTANQMTATDRMAVSLWRVYGRWCNTPTSELLTAFRRRLTDYERACDAERAQLALMDGAA